MCVRDCGDCISIRDGDAIWRHEISSTIYNAINARILFGHAPFVTSPHWLSGFRSTKYCFRSIQSQYIIIIILTPMLITQSMPGPCQRSNPFQFWWNRTDTCGVHTCMHAICMRSYMQSACSWSGGLQSPQLMWDPGIRSPQLMWGPWQSPVGVGAFGVLWSGVFGVPARGWLVPSVDII